MTDGRASESAAPRRALRKVLASPEFEDFNRLRQLLQHIVEQTLDGRSGAIKAITIAQDVYGRDPIADPRAEAVVRGDVSRLRRRLEHYYLTDGRDDPLIIEVPRGGYVAGFKPRQSAVPQSSSPARISIPPGGPVEQPSLAVLPFRNLSGDPAQQYFSDGITADIIVELSRFRWLRVIAPTGTIGYRDVPVDARTVTVELKVRFLLEGSVRRTDDHVRLTAQLIDGSTGEHIWAERYDPPLQDVFEIQDALGHAVAAAIEPELMKAEQRRVARKPAESIDAWDSFHRGMWHQYRRTQSDFEAALTHFRHAINLDPGFAMAYAALAETLNFMAILGHVRDSDDATTQAVAAARTAVELDHELPIAHRALGVAHLSAGELEPSMAELETAVSMNPNSAQSFMQLATALVVCQRLPEAIAQFSKAIEISPKDLYIAPMMGRLGMTHLLNGDCEAARHWAVRSLRQHHAPWPCDVMLTAALGYLGRKEEAAKALAALMGKEPRISEAFVRQRIAMRPEQLDIIIAGLRRSGLPD